MKKKIFNLLVLLTLVSAVFPASPPVMAAGEQLQAAAEQLSSESIFDNAKINKMIDDNYKEVEANGYAELRIPEALHKIPYEVFSKNALDAGEKLIDNGYEAYVIGGAVRDLIMGTETSDFDIATNATIDEQIEIFGDMLSFHTTQTGRTFGYLNYPDEVIDLAQFQNIPLEYHGEKNIPDFDTENYSTTSTSIVCDSFQRDLTFNAIYYDVKTHDIVDYHGGIHDIREKRISTIVDAALIFDANPAAAIRALRFKARYGYDFSDNVDSNMNSDAAKYMRMLTPESLSGQLYKMYEKGYGAECYDLFNSYSLMEEFYPPVKDICKTDSYIKYVRDGLSSIDLDYKTGKSIDTAKATAYILVPAALRNMSETSDIGQSIENVLDEQEKRYTYYQDEKERTRRFMSELAAAAYKDVNVAVNGSNIDFEAYDNALPYIETYYTLIPIRAVAESLGLDVSWNEVEQEVYITNSSGINVGLTIGSTNAKVGDDTVALGVPAKITNDRTYVPLRFVAEAFNAKVGWDEQTRSVNISK